MCIRDRRKTTSSSSRKHSIEALEEEKKKKLEALKVEEAPAFAGLKLKKSEIVKREWDEGKIEAVELKSHEFEVSPELEFPEESAGTVKVTLEVKDLEEIAPKKKVVLKKRKVRRS